MLKNFRFLGFVSALVVLLFSLAACSSESNGEGAEGGGSDGGKVELTLFHDWTDDSPDNNLQKGRIEEFNESQDKIEVKLNGTAHNEYRTKLKTMAAGGELPDMFITYPGAETKPFVEGNAIQPLNEFAEKKTSELVNESAVKPYTFDGNTYAVPAAISYTTIVYYNEDVLAEVGYDEFPKTYKELKELVTALKEAGYTPIAAGNKGQWPLQSVYISTIADRLTGSDFLEKALNGEAKFTDPKFVEAISVIEELDEMGAFNEDINTIDETEARSNFIKGESGIYLSGSWSTAAILENKPDDINISAASFPSIEGGEGDSAAISGVSSRGIAISSKLSEEETAAAKEFLDFFYDEEIYKGLLANGTLVPADIPLPEGSAPLFEDVYNLVKDGEVAPVYDATLPSALTETINSGLQGIITDSLTPEELAKKMQEEYEKLD